MKYPWTTRRCERVGDHVILFAQKGGEDGELINEFAVGYVDHQALVFLEILGERTTQAEGMILFNTEVRNHKVRLEARKSDGAYAGNQSFGRF